MAHVYLTEAGGSWGPTNHRLCLNAAYAFFRCVGVPALTSYAGRKDGSYAFYKLTLTDPAGKKAVGWLGPADAVITLATAVGITGITKANPGVITFAPGHGFTGGELIRLSGLTQMVALNGSFVTLSNKVGDTFEICDTSTYTAETTGGNCAQLETHVGNLGCHILSSVNGTTRGWESIEAGFAYNAASYTFEVTRDFFLPMALYWVTSAGASHLLGQQEESREGRVFGPWANFDLPPVGFQVAQLPMYQGEYYKGRKFQPRTLTIPFTFVQNDLDGYWAERDALIGALDPAAVGYLKAIIVLSTGIRVRHLACVPAGPLAMDGGNRYGRYGQRAVLQFIAHYPLWFNPVEQSAYVNLNGATPVTLDVTVAGHEEAFPRFYFAANANTPQVQRGAVAADYIKVEKKIASTDFVTVYTTVGNKRAVDSAGARVQLSGDSKFFTLPGATTTTLTLSATSGAGRATVYWTDYYRGL